MNILDRIIADITWWRTRQHPPLSKLSDWQRAHEAEQIALRRGCTQDVHRAREAKRRIVNADLARCGGMRGAS